MTTEIGAQVARPRVAESTASYVDWGAIIAGSVLAAALSIILLSFGGAIGLSTVSPRSGEGASAVWIAIAAGVWFVWTMVSSFGAGAYVTGRLRGRIGDATPPEVEARDGAHGLVVWAVGALVGITLAAAGVSGSLSIGAKTVGAGAAVVAEAAPEYYSDLVLRNENAGAEIDAAAASEVAGILRRGIAVGEIVERDQQRLSAIVASSAGIAPEAAAARVDEALSEIDDARETAVETAERARVAGVIFGFLVAASLLASGVAAFACAAAGGRHRDEGLGFDAFAARR